MFKTDILFTGFYGQKNTGDDAFVEVASWGAQNIWKKFNSRFLAIDSNLPKVIVPAKGYPFSIPKTYNFQNRILLQQTDCLISAGGSTIHSKMDSNNVKMLALRRKLTKGEIKIGAIGVSVGPFKTAEDERAIEEYLKNIDFLAVRDRASYEYVSSLSLPYKPVNAFDLAALLPEIYDFQKKRTSVNKKKIVGISVCPYESLQFKLDTLNEKRRNMQTIALLKKIQLEEDVHYKFFIINGNEQKGDKSLTNETIQRVLPKSFEVVEYSPNTQKVWLEVASCDFVISTRLHAAIFACFSGTPFMLNEYHKKCSDFLDNIGYNESYRVYDSDYDCNVKANEILSFLANRNNYIFPQNISEMKRSAMLNFTGVEI